MEFNAIKVLLKMNYKFFVENAGIVKLTECKSCPTGLGSSHFILSNKKIFLDFKKKKKKKGNPSYIPKTKTPFV